MPRRTRAEIDPLFAEVEVLGTLVKQMAEAMSDLEAKVEDQQAIAPPPRAPSLPRYPQVPLSNSHPAEQEPAYRRRRTGRRQQHAEAGSAQYAPSNYRRAGSRPPSICRGTGPAHRDMAELDRRYGVHAPRAGR